MQLWFQTSMYCPKDCDRQSPAGDEGTGFEVWIHSDQIASFHGRKLSPAGMTFYASHSSPQTERFWVVGAYMSDRISSSSLYVLITPRPEAYVVKPGCVCPSCSDVPAWAL